MTYIPTNMAQQPFLKHEQNQSLHSIQVASKSSSHTIYESPDDGGLYAPKKKPSVASVFTVILEILLSALTICFIGTILLTLEALAKMSLLNKHSPHWSGALAEREAHRKYHRA